MRLKFNYGMRLFFATTKEPYFNGFCELKIGAGDCLSLAPLFKSPFYFYAKPEYSYNLIPAVHRNFYGKYFLERRQAQGLIAFINAFYAA